MGSINNLSSSYIQSVLNNVLQSSGLTNNPTNLSSAGISSVTPPPDNGQLSPFAQLMSTLQQLQQSDPTKYQQITQQIASNLQSAAQTATTDGNSTAANQLNQLATDFTNASKSGQLPNIQDLAQALGGHHHHHHGHHSDADSSSSSASSSTSNGTQNTSLNPMSIIMNTLSTAGISVSNG